MANPYVGFTWEDRVSEYPTRRKLTDTTTLEEKQYTVARDEGTVTTEGTPFTAYYMNNLEGRINTAFGLVPETLSGTSDPTSSTGKNGDTYYKLETENNVTTVVGMFVRISNVWYEISTGGASLPQAEGSEF